MPMRIESTAAVAASPSSTNPSTQGAAQTSATVSAKESASTTTAIDPATGQPKPPKYPWITRLTLELEQNAQKDKTSPFKQAEIAGETLNKLV